MRSNGECKIQVGSISGLTRGLRGSNHKKECGNSHTAYHALHLFTSSPILGDITIPEEVLSKVSLSFQEYMNSHK